MNDLVDRARAVLDGNWTGRHTVPSRKQYPHQWSWDSAFIALGWRHLDPSRARTEMRALLDAQWADGRLPHIVFDPGVPADAYFPGPAFWRSSTVDGTPPVETTGLVQPPVHAWAVWEVHRAAPDLDYLREVYPRLVAWHRYLTERRDLGGAGAIAVLHPWESGMDNSPAWDAPMARIEPVPGIGAHRRDLTHGHSAERPTDDDYGRYIRIAGDYRDGGYVDRPGLAFAVEDPLTTALLAASESALAEMAAAIGADPAPHRARVRELSDALMTRLYDAEAGLFLHRDLVSGELIREHTLAGLAPLVVEDLPVAASLVETALGERFRIGAACLPPSYDLTSPKFEPARYWRGPGWWNTTWLLWRGLRRQRHFEPAADLHEAMLRAVDAVGFREYVDPHTGSGHGSTDFSWTAAVVVDILHEPDP